MKGKRVRWFVPKEEKVCSVVIRELTGVTEVKMQGLVSSSRIGSSFSEMVDLKLFFKDSEYHPRPNPSPLTERVRSNRSLASKAWLEKRAVGATFSESERLTERSSLRGTDLIDNAVSWIGDEMT